MGERAGEKRAGGEEEMDLLSFFLLSNSSFWRCIERRRKVGYRFDSVRMMAIRSNRLSSDTICLTLGVRAERRQRGGGRDWVREKEREKEEEEGKRGEMKE